MVGEVHGYGSTTTKWIHNVKHCVNYTRENQRSHYHDGNSLVNDYWYGYWYDNASHNYS